jgi:hypothetical protein
MGTDFILECTAWTEVNDKAIHLKKMVQWLDRLAWEIILNEDKWR